MIVDTSLYSATECAIIVFEDAKSGIESAKRAGAGKIIGVTSMLDSNSLLCLGASTTITDFNDIDKIRLLGE